MVWGVLLLQCLVDLLQLIELSSLFHWKENVLQEDNPQKHISVSLHEWFKTTTKGFGVRVAKKIKKFKKSILFFLPKKSTQNFLESLKTLSENVVALEKV